MVEVFVNTAEAAEFHKKARQLSEKAEAELRSLSSKRGYDVPELLHGGEARHRLGVIIEERFG